MNTCLTDPFDRCLNYLRVSITDRCNLKCLYCMPNSSEFEWLPHDEILRYEEILKIVAIGVRLGISKVRVTGGEPLVRKGVYEFLEELSRIPGIADLSLTTNAVLLAPNLKRLRNAGVRRLNISLDTLKKEKYRRITGIDGFDRVWRAIMAAHDEGFSPIKINAVAMNGVNDDELADLARLSLSYPFHIRFIEYMPIGDHHLDTGKRLLAPEIMARLETIAPLTPVAADLHDGPAERFRFPGAPGEIGVIRPLSHHFCSRCNRLRLTASGHLRPCLLSDRTENLKAALRSGCTETELERLILKAVRFKPRRHTVDGEDGPPIHSVMSSIGG